MRPADPESADVGNAHRPVPGGRATGVHVPRTPAVKRPATARRKPGKLVAQEYARRRLQTFNHATSPTALRAMIALV